jgi:hypothetical protein
MERIDDSANLELLQRANVCFAAFFERFSGAPSAAPDEELRALLQLHQALESVGALLDGPLQSAISREVHAALDCYRQNLIRLRSQLAIMQQSAMARRQRLDCRQEHLSGAKAWCIASRAIT